MKNKELCLMIGIVLTFIHWIWGEETGKRNPAPDAEAVLQRLAWQFDNLKSFEFDTNITLTVQQPPITTVTQDRLKIAVKKPHYLRIQSGLEGDELIACNDEEMVSLNRSLNEVIYHPAPDTILQALRTGEARRIASQAPLLENLLQEDIYQGFAGTAQIERKPDETINGIACQRLGIKYNERSQFDLWIQATGQAEPIKMMAHMKVNDVTVDLKWEFRNWSMDRIIDDRIFQYEAPPSYKRVAQFRQPQSTGENHPMLNRQAPDFQLKTADGQAISLASHKNQDIIILDFWASWCGPCRKAMPMIVRVSEAHRKKQVVLYPINYKEDEATVKQFLQETSFDIIVPLDIQGKVASAFGVSAFPTTMLIDKQGMIRAVHVGLPEDGDRILTSEIESIIAGYDVSAEKVIIEPDEALVDKPISFRAILSNHSNAAIPAGSFNIALSLNGEKMYYSRFDQAIPALGKTEFVIKPTKWYFQSDKASRYQVAFQIDPDDLFIETDKTNNSAQTTLEIKNSK